FERGRDDGLAVAVVGRSVLPVPDQVWAGRQDLGESGVGGVEGGADASVGGERLGAAPLGCRKGLCHGDDVSKAEQIPIVAVLVRICSLGVRRANVILR